MRIGIVGSEASKFTEQTERIARELIRQILKYKLEYHPDIVVVSGACHLGGIDIWAIEEAKKLNLKYQEFPALEHKWSGKNGYESRNLLIASTSDEVYCITIKEYPPNYNGMKFKFCYHCNTDEHIKSGGCWTVKQAKERFGNRGHILVI